jgi:hypothetical protein
MTGCGVARGWDITTCRIHAPLLLSTWHVPPRRPEVGEPHTGHVPKRGGAELNPSRFRRPGRTPESRTPAAIVPARTPANRRAMKRWDGSTTTTPTPPPGRHPGGGRRGGRGGPEPPSPGKEGAPTAPSPRPLPAATPSPRGGARPLPGARPRVRGGDGGGGGEAEGAGPGGITRAGRDGPSARPRRGRRERVEGEAGTTRRSPNSPSPSMDTHRTSTGAAPKAAA